MLTCSVMVRPNWDWDRDTVALWADTIGPGEHRTLHIEATAAEFTAAGATVTGAGAVEDRHGTIADAALTLLRYSPTLPLDGRAVLAVAAAIERRIAADRAAAEAESAAADAIAAAAAAGRDAESAAAAASERCCDVGRAQWAALHGSAHLRRLIREGLPHLAAWRDEWLARERPGWRPGSNVPASPVAGVVTPAMLATLDLARTVEPAAQLRHQSGCTVAWVIHPLAGPICLPCD